MSHRYYSPLRPLSLGTFPKPQGNEILHIENFEERQNVRNTGKDLEKDKTECLISYSQSGCPAVRQREKIRLLVSSYGERQELNT